MSVKLIFIAIVLVNETLSQEEMTLNCTFYITEKRHLIQNRGILKFVVFIFCP